MIAHWPAKLKRQGELDTQPGHLIDIMATCVDVAGAEYPKAVGDHKIKPLEGVSLAPAFTKGKLNRPNPIFWEHEANRAIRDGKWKLVAKENKPWELYDMEADRTERNNLADARPALVKELTAKWDAWAARADVLPLGAWRGKPNEASLNKKQKHFSLKQGDNLDRAAAPFVEKRTLQIKADIANATDGVIVAQGGEAEGYALYIDDMKPTFALRQQGKLTLVAASERISTVARQLEATLTKQGKIVVKVDGETVATGTADRVTLKMPIDGLQVGSDLNGTVGEYDAPFQFAGTIHGVTLDVLNK